MKMTLIPSFLLFAVWSCGQDAIPTSAIAPTISVEEQTVDSIIEKTPLTNNTIEPKKFTDPYEKLSAAEVNQKYVREIKQKINGIKAKSEQHYTTVYNLLLDIFPYWYGTTWDYNGYTHQPRNGEVACGYFVSTTLRDAGFHLNRYDLAKCYSHKIVTTVCDSARKFTTIAALEEFIASRPNDIYIVGLDNHVGYLVKENSGIYFMHSSYIDPVAVVKESIKTSEALAYSEVFILGSVLDNKPLLTQWKSNAKISVTR